MKPGLHTVAPIWGLNTTEEPYVAAFNKYENDLTEWIEGEMTEKYNLITRIYRSVLPQSVKNMTSKRLFDSVVKSRKEGATVPYQTAMRNLLYTMFSTTAEDCCDKFMQNYLSVNISAEWIIQYSSKGESANLFVIPHGVASHLFIIGTEATHWLST